MPAASFSIRFRLLLFGLIATGSIWIGAGIAYVNLRTESQRFEQIRAHFQLVDRYAEVARFLARERGLSFGWLVRQQATPPAELSDVRQSLDEALTELGKGLTRNAQVAEFGDLQTLRAQLDKTRIAINAQDLAPLAAFHFYIDAIDHVLTRLSGHRADGMIAVGMRYEYVDHLQRSTELLAQLRGLTYGAVASGALNAETSNELLQTLALYTDAARGYKRTLPPEAHNGYFETASVIETLQRINAMLAANSVATLGLDATAWWQLATDAVEALQKGTLFRSTELLSQANAHLADLHWRLQVIVAALIALGVLTLALAIGTVRRAVMGLHAVLDGLSRVSERRDFSVRITGNGQDEFATISNEVNRLISIAGKAVDEQSALGRTDPLTGVLNRRGFDEQVTAVMNSTPAVRVQSVLMIDLDHFKSINDTFGHSAGDQVLHNLGRLLRAQLRRGDILARFGGEEFIALLPDCHLVDAVTVAEKLREAIADFDFGIDRRVTASIGAAQQLPDQSFDDVAAAADEALYRAKEGGRNRVIPTLTQALQTSPDQPALTNLDVPNAAAPEAATTHSVTG